MAKSASASRLAGSRVSSRVTLTPMLTATEISRPSSRIGSLNAAEDAVGDRVGGGPVNIGIAGDDCELVSAPQSRDEVARPDTGRQQAGNA